uniref:Uncharacterized protein n=1 Tax=viral metagenome TaxID=1070528 RepID=A0A6C0DPW1_9ZZZZ
MPKYEGFSMYNSQPKTVEGLTTNYQNLIKLRNNLDTKLKNLSQTKQGVFAEEKLRKDSNVYTGLLLTVLASSLVVYIFLKLD